MIKYFTLKELGANSESQFHYGFLDKLQFLREELGSAMFVTSCCRSEKHNKKVGGVKRSLHIWDFPAYAKKGQKGCMAIDVACPSEEFKKKLVNLAYSLDWSVGIDDKRNFVHLDRRIDLGLLKVKFWY